jgi:uncharacterized tellurite resistance protein B-like protein
LVLRRFAELLFPKNELEDTPHDKDKVALATCVVLLEAARVDTTFTETERRHVLDTIAKRFQLDSVAA